jgi:hypothetical protein
MDKTRCELIALREKIICYKRSDGGKCAGAAAKLPDESAPEVTEDDTYLIDKGEAL